MSYCLKRNESLAHFHYSVNTGESCDQLLRNVIWPHQSSWCHIEVYFICDDGESLLLIRAPTKQQGGGEDVR